MGRHLKAIGGEQWFNLELFNNKLDNFNNTEGVFLSGGQSAIQFILEDIEIESDEYILMPSYLCPSILYNFNRLNIKYKFYKINKDLSIDLDDIKEKIKTLKIKAVFFINYFGFYHNENTLSYFKELKKQNIKIIEDSVQMLWFDKKSFIGDYVFNSYRKFLPIDGSLVLCNKVKKFKFIKDSYYKKVNLARAKKTIFQNFNIGNEEEFLNLYHKAEEEYYKRDCVIGMNNKSKELLSKIDYKYIFNKRKENYFYLYDRLTRNKEINIIYDKKSISDNSALGLPILIDNRDEMRIKLRKFNIYCPVHWNIKKQKIIENYRDSVYLSENILMLPIDQRYEINDMEKLAITILRLI